MPKTQRFSRRLCHLTLLAAAGLLGCDAGAPLPDDADALELELDDEAVDASVPEALHAEVVEDDADAGPAIPASHFAPDEEVVTGETVVMGPDGPMTVTYVDVDGIAFVDGDIELGPVELLAPPQEVDLDALSAGDTGVSHAFTPVPIWGQAWSGGVVFYVFPDTGWTTLNWRIWWAIILMEGASDLDFVEVTEAQSILFPHIYFTQSWLAPGTASSDSIGRKGGRQYIRFSILDEILNNLPSIGLVQHELGHAVGLFHEHQRQDRDSFVFYNPFCVAQGQSHNFQKRTGLALGPYDQNSLMHYGAGTFGNGLCNPLTPIAGGTLGGNSLTAQDINGLNWLASW